MRIEILGVPFDKVTSSEALDRMLAFLKTDKNNIVYTPNPEMLMACKKDKELLKAFKSAELLIADGVGVVWASRFAADKSARIKERVTGCDLTLSLFDKIRNTGETVYLLGASPGTAEIAKKKMEKKYPGLKIIGVHDGFFDDDEERLIIKEIKAKKPDVLVVGMSAPRQEKWIYRNRKLPVHISMGVGGSIDIMAGTVKRAPVFFQKFGIEWLFRFISQPRKRAARMMKLPLFVIEVLKDKYL